MREKRYSKGDYGRGEDNNEEFVHTQKISKHRGGCKKKFRFFYVLSGAG